MKLKKYYNLNSKDFAINTLVSFLSVFSIAAVNYIYTEDYPEILFIGIVLLLFVISVPISIFIYLKNDKRVKI